MSIDLGALNEKKRALIASEINIARFYWHIFEEFQAAPINNIAYVFGEVLAGMTRALIAVIVIVTLGFLLDVYL